MFTKLEMTQLTLKIKIENENTKYNQYILNDNFNNVYEY